jgi:uncharacterized membrane protein YcaP (DUF421 family)
MESVLRGVAVYLILLAIMRISGRRTVAQMTPFDFVLLLIIAETTQQALLGDDFSITNAVVLIVTLFGLDIALSYLKAWWPAAGKLLDGVPTVLMRDGKLDRRALQRSRMEESDILIAARDKHGLEKMADIKHAVLEVDSGISVIPKERS